MWEQINRSRGIHQFIQRFIEYIWRRERDSNPRDGCPPTRVPGVRLQPLGHLSVSQVRGDATRPMLPGALALGGRSGVRALGRRDYSAGFTPRKQELVLEAVRRYASSMIRSLFANLLLFSARMLRGLVWVIWLVFRPAVRFISAVLILAAVIAATADFTRWQVGDTTPSFHSLAHHIQAVAPATFKGLAQSISQALHPVVWDYGVYLVLSLPAWLLFGVIGLAIALAGREPRRVNVFIN